MHMVVNARRGTQLCVPLFGLNADKTLGTLLVTGRGQVPNPDWDPDDPDSPMYVEAGACSVGILPFAPPGTPTADQSIVPEEPVDGMAVIETVLVPEGGFCFDGVPLSDVSYLYYDGTADIDIDVSFIPNTLPVRVL